MSINTSVKTRLIQHYKCIGVNAHDSIRLASLIVKWVKKNGHEWTVKRLKDAQQAHRHSLQTGEPYTVPTGWATRRNRSGRIIYKDDVMHRMSANTSRAKLEKRLVFFRTHEVVKLPKETKDQYRKWISGVTPDYLEPMRSAQQVLRLSSVIDGMKLPVPHLDQRSNFSPLLYQSIREKTSPVAIDGRVFSAPRDCIEVYDIGPLRSPLWFHLSQDFPELTSECLTGNGNQRWYVDTILSNGPVVSTNGGTIGFIQEKSAKLRAVASPYLVYQAMGEPAKQQLSRLSEIIPEMYTHNQDAAKQLVGETLKTGQKVYGFDASAFTDRLPYDLQRVVLDKLRELKWVTEFDCRVFDAMVESDWVLHSHQHDGSPIKWGVGQPMGFGPSFHLAAITHYIILRCCAEKAGVTNYHNKFCVVGDDVSIFDDLIAQEYLEVMGDLGVDINLEKSVISNETAEFCKKVILPGEVLDSVTVQNNIRNKHALAMAIDFYGRPLMGELSKKQLSMADIAMLPVDMGGLSLSPHGMNYKQYLEKILNTDNIRSYYLERELLDFYEVSTSDALELTLLRTVERMDHWRCAPAYYCDDSFRVPIVPQDSAISEYTGLPATHRLPEDELTSKADGYRSPWLRVFDISIRSYYATGASELPASSNNILGRFGFIYNSEKAPLRPIISKEKKVYDQNPEELDKRLERVKGRNFLRCRARNFEW